MIFRSEEDVDRTLGRVRQGSAGLAFVSRTVSEIEITSHR
jgi:hypothetical protein